MSGGQGRCDARWASTWPNARSRDDAPVPGSPRICGTEDVGGMGPHGRRLPGRGVSSRPGPSFRRRTSDAKSVGGVRASLSPGSDAGGTGGHRSVQSHGRVSDLCSEGTGVTDPAGHRPHFQHQFRGVLRPGGRRLPGGSRADLRRGSDDRRRARGRDPVGGTELRIRRLAGESRIRRAGNRCSYAAAERTDPGTTLRVATGSRRHDGNDGSAREPDRVDHG